MSKEAVTSEKSLEEVTAFMADLIVDDIQPEYDARKNQNTRERQIWLDEHRSVYVTQIEPLYHPGNNRYIVQLMVDSYRGSSPANFWEQWDEKGTQLSELGVDSSFDVKEILAEAVVKTREEND